MSKKSSNFPREGLHTIVTHAAIKRLEAERPTLNEEIHYTIGGAVETIVHTSAYAEREAAITAGVRRLTQNAQELRAAYVREQKALCARWCRHARHNAKTR